MVRRLDFLIDAKKRKHWPTVLFLNIVDFDSYIPIHLYIYMPFYLAPCLLAYTSLLDIGKDCLDLRILP